MKQAVHKVPTTGVKRVQRADKLSPIPEARPRLRDIDRDRSARLLLAKPPLQIRFLPPSSTVIILPTSTEAEPSKNGPILRLLSDA